MLVNNTIDVYDFSLAASPAEYEKRIQFLSAHEVDRAQRFKFDRHRTGWVTSRAVLRTVLAAHLDQKPHDISFSLGKNGKPFVDCNAASDKQPGSKASQPPELYFNLSHSHERGMIAVCKNLEIGCDIEHVKRVNDWPAVTRRFFSRAEQQELSELDISLRPLAFFLGWTRKEAVIKATGEGLQAELDAFDVTLTPGEPALVTAHRHASQANSNWRLRHFEPCAGYVAAVAINCNIEPDFRYHTNWVLAG